MHDRIRSLSAVAVIVFGVALWWLTVRISGSLIFPTPWQVVLGMVQLIQQGVLLKHVAASLFRVTYGYLVAATLAIMLGLLMGRFRGACGLQFPRADPPADLSHRLDPPGHLVVWGERLVTDLSDLSVVLFPHGDRDGGRGADH